MCKGHEGYVLCVSRGDVRGPCSRYTKSPERAERGHPESEYGKNRTENGSGGDCRVAITPGNRVRHRKGLAGFTYYFR